MKSHQERSPQRIPKFNLKKSQSKQCQGKDLSFPVSLTGFQLQILLYLVLILLSIIALKCYPHKEYIPTYLLTKNHDIIKTQRRYLSVNIINYFITGSEWKWPEESLGQKSQPPSVLNYMVKFLAFLSLLLHNNTINKNAFSYILPLPHLNLWFAKLDCSGNQKVLPKQSFQRNIRIYFRYLEIRIYHIWILIIDSTSLWNLGLFLSKCTDYLATGCFCGQ